MPQASRSVAGGSAIRGDYVHLSALNQIPNQFVRPERINVPNRTELCLVDLLEGSECV